MAKKSKPKKVKKKINTAGMKNAKFYEKLIAVALGGLMLFGSYKVCKVILEKKEDRKDQNTKPSTSISQVERIDGYTYTAPDGSNWKSKDDYLEYQQQNNVSFDSSIVDSSWADNNSDNEYSETEEYVAQNPDGTFNAPDGTVWQSYEAYEEFMNENLQHTR